MHAFPKYKNNSNTQPYLLDAGQLVPVLVARRLQCLKYRTCQLYHWLLRYNSILMAPGNNHITTFCWYGTLDILVYRIYLNWCRKAVSCWAEGLASFPVSLTESPSWERESRRHRDSSIIDSWNTSTWRCTLKYKLRIQGFLMLTKSYSYFPSIIISKAVILILVY